MSERIGVYICHCGTNISHTVDTVAVAEFARTLPDVVVVREYKYMCSDPGQVLIKDDIAPGGPGAQFPAAGRPTIAIRKDLAAERLTHVVVASCSPLMHEETFRNACEHAGLNRFLFQMVNIREQCSWVHVDRAQATEKAKRLIAAAVRRVRYHRPMERREVPVRAETLVVGGGIAGIEAALRIAESGKKVYLVEREPSIGGHMAKFDKTFPTLDCAACILTPKMVQVGQHPNIEILSYSEVEEASGHVGDFKVKVRRNARYVDEKKCTGCGQCTERCPVQFKPLVLDGHEPAPPVELDPRIKTTVEQAVELHQHERGPLVSILQDINLDLGYLPEQALRYVSWKVGIPLARVYHVATFYKAFSLVPRGEHVIKVCVGTACHVRGSARVVEALEQRLEIKAGQTTKDMKFTLETVNCLGACAMGPVVVVDGQYQTVRPSEVGRLVKALAGEPVEV